MSSQNCLQSITNKQQEQYAIPVPALLTVAGQGPLLLLVAMMELRGPLGAQLVLGDTQPETQRDQFFLPQRCLICGTLRGDVMENHSCTEHFPFSCLTSEDEEKYP